MSGDVVVPDEWIQAAAEVIAEHEWAKVGQPGNAPIGRGDRYLARAVLAAVIPAIQAQALKDAPHSLLLAELSRRSAPGTTAVGGLGETQ